MSSRNVQESSGSHGSWTGRRLARTTRAMSSEFYKTGCAGQRRAILQTGQRTAVGTITEHGVERYSQSRSRFVRQTNRTHSQEGEGCDIRIRCVPRQSHSLPTVASLLSNILTDCMAQAGQAMPLHGPSILRNMSGSSSHHARTLSSRLFWPPQQSARSSSEQPWSRSVDWARMSASTKDGPTMWTFGARSSA